MNVKPKKMNVRTYENNRHPSNQMICSCSKSKDNKYVQTEVTSYVRSELNSRKREIKGNKEERGKERRKRYT